MTLLQELKKQVTPLPEGGVYARDYYMAKGYRAHLDKPVPVARAHAIAALFLLHEKHIYLVDPIAGSWRGLLSNKITTEQATKDGYFVNSFGRRSFGMNGDHFVPDHQTLLKEGLLGMREKVEAAKKTHAGDGKKQDFLEACRISLEGFSGMIFGYAEKAEQLAQAAKNAAEKENLLEVAATCRHVAEKPPETFRQALQLVWFLHVAFFLEGRHAMALGRIDQTLLPYYEKDCAKGRLTPETARLWLACTFYKITEVKIFFGWNDTVNICIGGVKRDGTDAVNPLSYQVLWAVADANVPGPNLSARLHTSAPNRFLDECLQVIGTGIGYPALMNDGVNIPALLSFGYSLEDCRDYAMVGCIENFMVGKQPPWTDGRFNVPKFLELALNQGKCMQTGEQLGPETENPARFAGMEDVMRALKAQSAHGAAEYMAWVRNEANRYDKVQYTEPFLSCFCQDCIARGQDINDGGAHYPSVHGAACVGIATIADSLAAIEKVVFTDKAANMETLQKALLADFEGYQGLQAALLAAPKYGNNHPLPDGYAVWYVDYYSELFRGYSLPDGGAVYIGIASNVQNINAGQVVAATPDGRKNAQPVSDAASPMHGKDISGPTAVANSLTKPDYKQVACGSVVNQKYSPDMFKNPEKRARLLSLIRTYFKKGGQEMQINAVSRKVLQDAMRHPEKYGDLVVRVSGFSSYYVMLDAVVQEDILKRTEHE